MIPLVPPCRGPVSPDNLSRERTFGPETERRPEGYLRLRSVHTRPQTRTACRKTPSARGGTVADGEVRAYVLSPQIVGTGSPGCKLTHKRYKPFFVNLI